MIIDIKEAEKLVTEFKKYRKYLHTKEGKEHFLNMPDAEAILLHTFYSSSSYATLFQKRFELGFDLEYVPQKMDRGDLKHSDCYYEFKLTGKEQPSWRQCRPYQNLDGYIFLILKDDYILYYYMDAAAAKEEIYAQNIFTHGTRESYSQNLCAEYDLNYKKHFEQYAVDLKFFENLFNTSVGHPLVDTKKKNFNLLDLL